MNEGEPDWSPRVLHVSYARNPPAGLVQQLSSEVEATRAENLPWTTVLLTDVQRPQSYMIQLWNGVGGRFHRLAEYLWLLRKRNQYDVLLLRHSKADLFGWLFMPFLGTVIGVHHTKEVEECVLDAPRWYGWLRSNVERHLGACRIRKYRAIAGVTGEIAEYERGRIDTDKPTIIIPNGISLERTEACGDRRDGSPTAVFVASHFRPWQGLDLLLESLEQTEDPSLHLILVGQLGSDITGRIRSSPVLREAVTLRGYLPPKRIAEVLAEADVGLSAFALDRNGMKEACSLKVREYLASGVPVYSGHPDSALPESFHFYEVGPPDVARIAAFALRHRQVSRVEVRADASEWIDKRAVVRRAYADISSVATE